MRTAAKVASGLGATALIGYLGYYLNETRTEKPRYRVAERDGAFELRDYPALLTAGTVDHGERERSLNAGFRALADYIFAKSRGGEQIAMTAPVIQDRDEDEGGWRTRFVMPAEYDRATLPPAPLGVEIGETPARRVAAVRFRGGQNDRRLAEKATELRRWLARRGLSAAAGKPEYAFYNSPMIAPPLRRNEVLIPIADDA